MTPAGHTKFSTNQFKLSRTLNFTSSYLIYGNTRPSYAILLRPRPEISLSVHPLHKHNRRPFVRRSWMTYLTHTVRPRMTDTQLSRQPIMSAQARDEEKSKECVTGASLFENLCLNDEAGTDTSVLRNRTPDIGKSTISNVILTREEPLEEPWLLQYSSLSFYVEESEVSNGMLDEDKIENFHCSALLELNFLKNYTIEDESESEANDINKTSSSYGTLSEKEFPVEEPWLFKPASSFPSAAIGVCNASKNIESIKDESKDAECQNLLQGIPGELFSEEAISMNEGSSAAVEAPTRSADQSESSVFDSTSSETNEESSIAMQKSFSTVILINSSLCTMQRIAVLEDGSLVELLLEPVKDNVHCDSVYLGVLTKLVPHMGGAFVDIGSSRPSLMDIKHYREAFVFPPFRRGRKEKDKSDLKNLKDYPEMTENSLNLDDAEDIDDPEEHETEDISVHYMRDDFGEHEIEDDFDVMEDFRDNVNGSVPGHGNEVESKTSLDQFAGEGHHIESQMTGKLPLTDLGFPPNLQDLEDQKDLQTHIGKWDPVRRGTKIIVQVVKEGLGTKGPTVTAYPKLRSRFWVLITRSNSIGVSKKLSGVERTRLRVIAKTLQPKGYGLTVRTVAAGHSLEELQKDLEGLLSTWKAIIEHAKSAALAADEGVEGAIPVLLHKALGQTLSVVQDYFNEKVKCMVVDSPRTYHEVTNYLQEIAPDLCDRVELYSLRTPLFDEYKVEEEFDKILSKRVPLSNGGYLVIEQTEALVSIDVNGGHCMLGDGTSQDKAILDVNLTAAKQIARELRLRDIGGIIVVDFIDMVDDSNKRLVYEEVKKAVLRDRSMVKVSELSRHGLMEITRKRVRPSLTFMVSEPCTCCHATGRVEALETSFSKIEHEICRSLALMDKKPDPGNPKSWPKFILMVDRHMCNYLTSGKRTRLAVLSSSLKVWILLKVARGFTRGAFELKPLTSEKDYKNRQNAISMFRPTEGGTYTPKGKVTIFPIKKWKTRGK
ncbi:CBM20 domain-containing protein [Heracleum sosnowskyi]|uniref:CBM20 domain-containing protein n=1 Tax=Heracleum sosnowskyi TaxID=360622 RepID=A0AAD8HRP8_9APIA|nr:CBM20 domain-containing protein [Heracleum sosnowskyi]